LLAFVPNEIYNQNPEAVIQMLGEKFVEPHDCLSGNAEVKVQRNKTMTGIEIKCQEVEI
jgi:hypothetical protein